MLFDRYNILKALLAGEIAHDAGEVAGDLKLETATLGLEVHMIDGADHVRRLNQIAPTAISIALIIILAACSTNRNGPPEQTIGFGHHGPGSNR